MSSTILLSGQPITLVHPYPSKVDEPSVYDDISRHAVCGSSFKCHTMSTSDSYEDKPKDVDWSVSSKCKMHLFMRFF